MVAGLQATVRRKRVSSEGRRLKRWESLLVTVVSRYRPYAMEWEDAMQEARIAALLALRSWDPARGATESHWVYCQAAGRLRYLATKKEFRVKPKVERSLVDEGEIAVPFNGELTLSLALCEAILSSFPPPLRVRQALAAAQIGLSQREAARSLGIHEDSLNTGLSNWRKRVAKARPDLVTIGASRPAPRDRPTHCPQGHDYSETRDKFNHCRECQSARNRAWYARQAGSGTRARKKEALA